MIINLSKSDERTYELLKTVLVENNILYFPASHPEYVFTYKQIYEAV